MATTDSNSTAGTTVAYNGNILDVPDLTYPLFDICEAFFGREITEVLMGRGGGGGGGGGGAVVGVMGCRAVVRSASTDQIVVTLPFECLPSLRDSYILSVDWSGIEHLQAVAEGNGTAEGADAAAEGGGSGDDDFDLDGKQQQNANTSRKREREEEEDEAKGRPINTNASTSAQPSSVSHEVAFLKTMEDLGVGDLFLLATSQRSSVVLLSSSSSSSAATNGPPKAMLSNQKDATAKTSSLSAENAVIAKYASLLALESAAGARSVDGFNQQNQQQQRRQFAEEDASSSPASLLLPPVGASLAAYGFQQSTYGTYDPFPLTSPSVAALLASHGASLSLGGGAAVDASSPTSSAAAPATSSSSSAAVVGGGENVVNTASGSVAAGAFMTSQLVAPRRYSAKELAAAMESGSDAADASSSSSSSASSYYPHNDAISRRWRSEYGIYCTRLQLLERQFLIQAQRQGSGGGGLDATESGSADTNANTAIVAPLPPILPSSMLVKYVPHHALYAGPK